MAELFGIDEVVDTLQDAMRMEMDIQESVSDGKYTTTEALTDALGNYPRVTEAVNDWSTFVKEISDYSVEENKELAERVGEQFSEETKAESFVYGAIVFVTQGYDTFNETRTRLEGLYNVFLSNVLKRD